VTHTLVAILILHLIDFAINTAGTVDIGPHQSISIYILLTGAHRAIGRGIRIELSNIASRTVCGRWPVERICHVPCTAVHAVNLRVIAKFTSRTLGTL
jgi:hypothetical protein